jgi:hypothetical protein
MDGYSYTTIISGRDAPPSVDVMFYLDDTAWIRVPGVGKERCHLHVRHRDATVTIAPVEPDHVTTTDIDVARQLAEATATYLAECERLHAVHTARDEQNSANAA